MALGDSQFGIVVLPTVLYLSKVLAKLAMGLDRRPELVAHLLRLEGGADQDESTEKVTLVEKSANGVHGKPEGKRVGIYLMANLCLKLLFQVRQFSMYLFGERLLTLPFSAASFVTQSRCLRVSLPNPLH
jgi:hypothetical protein